MADAIRYVHPLEQITYTCDFQDLLPTTDSTLNDIGSGSTITATKSDGGDAAAILFTKTRTSKTLIVTLKNLEEGEEYLVTFLGQGTTSTQRFVRTVLFLVRKDLVGEF
jgi:hypothetical protein